MKKKMRPYFFFFFLLFLAIIFSFFLLFSGTKKPSPSSLKEADFYHPLGNGQVACDLCPNRCVLKEGQRGVCRVRENLGGKLYTLVYGKVVTQHLDPIEKKPFFHFLPSAKAYSLATAGCNLNCQYCQNWDIAQRAPEDLAFTLMKPEEVVVAAQKAGASVIAFTYNEPTVWYEYMFDIAQKAKEKGLKTVMVSSGFINPEPLQKLLPFLDAVKIDLKSFNSEVYQTLIRGRLEPVLENIKLVHQSGKWLELVHLVVPGYTDDLEEIRKMCLWVKENVSADVPIHFSRFWPNYKLLNLPPTPEETVKKARQECLSVGLKYVYTGNLEEIEGGTTYCPLNQKPLIKREGFFVKENWLDGEGKSSLCPVAIPGVWK